jgi:hypothetical protein
MRVHVRHIADVAADLCGRGSAHACHITDHLAHTTTETSGNPANADGLPHAAAPATVR